MEKNDFYNIEEVCTILNCSRKKIYELIESKILISYGQNSINSLEVSRLVQFLNETYKFQEVVTKVKSDDDLKDIHPASIKNYINRYFDKVVNPLNYKDFRFYKKDFERLLELIKTNYSSSRKINENIKYVIESYAKSKNIYTHAAERKSDLYCFDDLKSLSKKYSDYSRFPDGEKLVKHILAVCNQEGIRWFTNSDKTNIYIKKESVSKFVNYYEKLKNFRKEDYYTNSEVKGILKLESTDRIVQYANAIKINNKIYMEKDKIDDLKDIWDNSISAKDLKDRLNIPTTSFYRLIKKFNIVPVPDKYPLPYGTFFYKSDIQIFEEYIHNKRQLEWTESKYERFLLETKLIKLHKIPTTLNAFDKFIHQRFKDNKGDYVYSSLIYIYKEVFPQLQKEIMQYSDEELKRFILSVQLIKAQSEFSFFLRFCKERYITKYSDDIKINPKPAKEKSSYTKQQWTDFALLLFTNEEDLIERCIDSRTNSMVWLYCALHFVCAWRPKDIYKMPYPDIKLVLGMEVEQLFDCIRNKSFTEAMAQAIVNDVILQIKTFHKQPGKNKKFSKQMLKFVVSDSFVETIGLLIALCTCHRKVAESNNWLNSNTIITERATKRETHLEAFGEKYIEIFESDTFKSNDAVRTFDNITQMVSNKENWGKGYDLASIIRGHKQGKKNGFAPTTQVYLKSINKDQDVDKITQALLERGCFGFMHHLLVQIILDDDNRKEYKVLDLSVQNEKINELIEASPSQIEQMARGINDYRNRVQAVFNELMIKDIKQVKSILEKLSMGEFPSKMEHSQCLLKTINKSACIYPYKEDCIGCEYALYEMYFLIEFNERFGQLVEKINNAKNNFDKERYTYTLFYIFLPIMQEAASFFGKERFQSFVIRRDLRNLLKEVEIPLSITR